MVQQPTEDLLHVREIARHHQRDTSIVCLALKRSDYPFNCPGGWRPALSDRDVVDPGRDGSAPEGRQIVGHGQRPQEPELDLGVSVVVRSVQIGGRSDDRVDFQARDAVEALGIVRDQDRCAGDGLQIRDVSRNRAKSVANLADRIPDEVFAFGPLAEAEITASDHVRARHERRHRRDRGDRCRFRVLAANRIEPASQPETGIQRRGREELAVTEGFAVSHDEAPVRLVLGDR